MTCNLVELSDPISYIEYLAFGGFPYELLRVWRHDALQSRVIIVGVESTRMLLPYGNQNMLVDLY